MLITAGAAAALGPLERPGIGIVSISGGACDIVADRAEDLGARCRNWPLPTEALTEIMPDYGTVQNPLDVTGAAIIDPTIFTRSIRAMAADPSVGVVGVIQGVPWFDDGAAYVSQRFVDAIGAGMADAACPTVFINQVLQPITDHTRTVMAHGGVNYVIPGLRQAIVAMRNVAWWSEVTREAGAQPRPSAAPATPRRRSAHGQWLEDAARRRPGGAGRSVVPARLVTTAEDAAKVRKFLRRLPPPKIVSPQILHKTTSAASALPARRGGAVREAFESVTTARRGVERCARRGRDRQPDALRRDRAARRRGRRRALGAEPRGRPRRRVGGHPEDLSLPPLPVLPARVRALLERLRGGALLAASAAPRLRTSTRSPR